MERRDFLQATSLFAAMGLLPNTGLIAQPDVETPPANPLQPFLLAPLPPLAHNGTMDIRVWVRNQSTGGVYSCVECAVAPKMMGPPPHLHHALDELMFVLEGTASVLVENEVVQIGAGGWHFRPRQLKHTFWNASDQPLRFVDMYFNQPFEEFLERIFHELTPEKGFPQGSEALKREHDKLNEKFGLEYAPDAFDQRQAIINEYGLR
jgi:mannose-6-phosphate isomerase-like protein (cupin superfamily)